MSDLLVRGDNLHLIVEKLGLRAKARRSDYNPDRDRDRARKKSREAKQESDAALLRGTIDFDDFADVDFSV